MDTQPNCEARSESGWQRRADRLRTRRATRSRRNWPSGLPSPSASANSIGFVPPWASAIHRNLRKKSELFSQRARMAGGGRSLVAPGCHSRNRPAFPVGRSLTDEATACNHPRACTAASLATPVEALAHPPVPQCGRTAPTMGLTHLHRKRTGVADGTAAALQLSSRRTLSQDTGDRQYLMKRSPQQWHGGRARSGK